MVNSSQTGGSFWARHKAFTDSLFKAAALFVTLKLAKVAIEKIEL